MNMNHHPTGTPPTILGRATTTATDTTAAQPAYLRIPWRLPFPGEPLVKVGQTVAAADPVLAMTHFPGRVGREQVARKMLTAPAATADLLLPPFGAKVQAGQPLARQSMFWHHQVAWADGNGELIGYSPSLGQVYLRERLPMQQAERIRIDIVRELGGNRNQFPYYLKVREGQKVEKGQLLATRELRVGKYRSILSPLFGTIIDVAPLLGTIGILPDTVSSVVKALVPGQILAANNQEVVVGARGVCLHGVMGVGGEAAGRLVVAKNDANPWRPGPDDDAKAEANSAPEAHAGAGLRGAVLVAGHVDAASLRAAEERGVKGAIAATIHQGQLCRWLGRELGVVATGEEKLPLVLILMKDFGQAALLPAVHARFAALAGRHAALAGATHIRAGVIRPWVAVITGAASTATADPLTRPEGDPPAPPTPNEPGRRSSPDTLQPGDTVIILRGPAKGQSAVVVAVPPGPRTISSGGHVPVVEVQPTGGAARLLVPRANVRHQA